VKNLRKRIVSQNDQHVNIDDDKSSASSPSQLKYIIVAKRPSPYIRAEQVKREYACRLDALLSSYRRELADALNVPELSPNYQLAEVDAYIHRLGRVWRAHEREVGELAAFSAEASATGSV
jgi:hypothetical protein